jgi:phosphatidylserine decarboxylase
VAHQLIKARSGGWLPQDREKIVRWIGRLQLYSARISDTLVPPIQALADMVAGDDALAQLSNQMFQQALEYDSTDPLGRPSVQNFQQFLVLLNAIMTTAPEAYEDVESDQPSGLIGFPINALLDWPMATDAGYAFFSNALVNQQFKKILQYWSEFLVGPDSRYVLTQSVSQLDPETVVQPWLGEWSQAEMVSVASSALGAGENPLPPNATFADVFNCDPCAEYYGFASWDDFFTRTFKAAARPISSLGDDNVIVNACESAPLQVVTNAASDTCFWLKGQPYSLGNMLDFCPEAEQFYGGTVYQAFLSALSYHRWNSPVSGVIRKAWVVNGTYYLENLYQGFAGQSGGDPSAPNDSQPFLTSVATRAIILIEADNPAIGLMAFVAVGMAEVSSCQITVADGQHVQKGDQLGMFHFGGSTHCLVFQPGVDLEFQFYGQTPSLNANNMRVNTALATVVEAS